ncbi:preprotein translocase subunit SecG [Campylobacter pinnipediorum]|uniref:Protein-export membrane protein SecG n=1 Tax=Campylobacter pinnipediorum subsp. pinnipediorum TaxID=1660067 RepID=A0AAX0L955_9BACT|nr:preprotein translocase subunit SecG [Campylobacter pinnipediorum]AQW81963.1 preprotein translocase SecYEG, SecG subunit [Campylobacter pinnipediorum subsp. pinnipediorum]AQW83634.1 preprotein translocase SecYEG, SecG subunit [Campylobacter pinnipediorum subsp. pinnipediorum]AQW85156.1 preprotein translocase SecYEG, SecG subunit [Campylobacter pinnipediorum subsp. pinnipediorum]OPA75877.1 preprotein translocase subunit SecG [Campylobacter pinnipediorum subsp. pinnipediorum]OPA76012.1 preprot
MSSLFLILQFVLAVIITIAVLLQKSSSIGLGAYSGSNESLFGAKGPAGFLAKFTFIAAVLFILNTLTLGYSYNKEMKKSLFDNIDTKTLNIPKAAEKKETSAPTAPEK